MTLKKQFLLLGLISISLSLPLIGFRPLWEPDESRYAICAREMIDSGDYLVPTLNDQPHLTKPPMTYWIISMGLKIFGYNEFGVRIFYAFAFTGVVLLTAGMAYRLGKPEAAFWAGLIYSTTLLPVIAANVVTTDTFLSFFESLSIFLFLSAMQTRGLKGKIYLWAPLKTQSLSVFS